MKVPPAAMVLVLSAPAFFVAYQAHPSQHFGIGRWDRAFLGDVEDFYPSTRTSGPDRNSDGTVEVNDFVIRLTKQKATLTLPYHAVGSPIEIFVRCHRFGLEGTVSLAVNSERIGEFAFVKTSYPWGGIRAVVPQGIAERGPLRIDLLTEGGEAPPAHLPRDLGVGLDFVEVRPLDDGARLLPTAGQWAGLVLFLISGYWFLRFLGCGPRARTQGVLALAVGLTGATVLFPTLVSRSLPLAWLAIPGGMLLLRAGELADRWFPVQKKKHE